MLQHVQSAPPSARKPAASHLRAISTSKPSGARPMYQRPIALASGIYQLYGPSQCSSLPYRAIVPAKAVQRKPHASQEIEVTLSQLHSRERPPPVISQPSNRHLACRLHVCGLIACWGLAALLCWAVCCQVRPSAAQMSPASIQTWSACRARLAQTCTHLTNGV